MTDIFDTTIMCDQCREETEKKSIEQEGFPIRVAECPSCNKQWPHPLDLEDYENFKRLKQKQFEVKLRLVGNSYTVSIPREIIDFEEEMQKEMDKMDQMIRMALEEPGKVSIFFTRKMKRLL